MKAKTKKRIYLGLAISLLSYLILNYLIVPLVVYKLVIPKVEEKFALQVELKSLAVQIVAGEVKLKGLDVKFSNDKLGGFNELFIDLALWQSLRRGGLVVEKFELKSPYVEARRYKDGVLNFELLLEMLPPSEPSQEEAIELFVKIMRLEDATISFADEALSREFTYQFDDLDLKLDDFSTMTGSGKESEVIIAIGDSTLITWKGEVGLSPLLSKGEVHVKKMNLADFDIYYDLVTDKLDLESGWFSTKFTYDFSPFVSKPVLKSKIEFAELSNFSVVDEDTKDVFQQIDKWRLEGLEVDLVGSKIAVEKLAVNGGLSSIYLTKDGAMSYLPSRFIILNPEVVAETAKVKAQHKSNVRLRATLLDLTQPLREKIVELWSSSWVSITEDVTVNDYKIALYDDFHGERKMISLDKIKLNLNHLQNLNEKSEVDLSFEFLEKEQKFNGEFYLGSLKADLSLIMNEMALHEFAPYLKDFTGIELSSAFLDLDAKIKVEMKEDLSKFENFDVHSNVELKDFDVAHEDKSMRFKLLRLDEIHFDLLKQEVSLKEFYLNAPFVSATLALPEPVAASEQKEAQQSILTNTQIEKNIDWDLEIGTIKIDDSGLDLTVEGF